MPISNQFVRLVQKKDLQWCDNVHTIVAKIKVSGYTHSAQRIVKYKD